MVGELVGAYRLVTPGARFRSTRPAAPASRGRRGMGVLAVLGLVGGLLASPLGAGVASAQSPVTLYVATRRARYSSRT